MGGQIDQRAAAGASGIDPPVVGRPVGREPAGVMDPRLRYDAQGLIGDKEAKASMRGVEPLVEGRRIPDACAVAGGHHAAGIR